MRAVTRSVRWTETLTFGGRLPWAIGLLLVGTVGLSLLTAFGDRHAAPLFELAALRPADVWRGQVWRLVTWPLIQPSALGLVWACVFLIWFGRDLALEWGSPRFLAVFGTVALIAAAGTCLVARLDSEVLEASYLSGYAIECAMTVAWGLWFPDRYVRLYFVIPVRGSFIAGLTIAITVFVAFYAGWEAVLPHLVAEGSTLAWLFRRSILTRWRQAHGALRQRQRAARRRQRERAASVAYQQVVENDDLEAEPLPADIEQQVSDLLSGRSRRGPG
jgi:membrane associated rhomboid family serine protease